MLRVENLSFKYGKDIILDNISFELAPGECLAVTGSNGCGKSTLLSLIAGILKPSSGSVITDGEKIGLVPQENSTFEDMSVLGNLSFFYGLEKRRLPRPLPFGLESYASKKAGQLSGGYAKRLNIACTFPMQPDIWLFDEPCANLDKKSIQEITDLVRGFKRAGKTILYVGHDSDEYMDYCDKILEISGGNGYLTQNAAKADSQV